MTSKRLGFRVLRMVLAVGILLLFSAAPAAATVAGPCTASVNGVEVERIDSLASPLELTVEDILTFHGTDEKGTRNVSVELKLASVRVDEGTTAYGPTQNEFTASIDLAAISPYGVGLFRLRGTTDNCVAEAWVRVGGKLPLATLTGITGLGLALGGLTGQLASVASRRRYSWVAASLAGIATGIGGAVLGQQFGRLQLSYISALIAVLGAAIIGALAAYLLRLKSGLGWFERRRYASEERREQREEARMLKQEERQHRDEDRARRAADRERRSAERSQESARQRSIADQEAAPRERLTAQQPIGNEDAPTPFDTSLDQATQPAPQPVAQPVAGPVAGAPAAAANPYWCYVMSPVEVLDLQEPTRVVAVLQPGNWYLARREAGEWVHVAADETVEGWAPRSSIHRQG